MSVVLAGCWDQRLFKNSSVVSLAGFEGKIGDLTAYYAYPEASKEMKTIIITGEGASPRDVRQNADTKTEQTMDLSVLSTLLIAEDLAKNDIYEYLDSYYRDVTNPITPRLAIVQGEIKPFLELSEEMQSSTGEFYNRFIKSLEENSSAIPYNLQTAGSVLFDEAQDLSLPYIKLDEQGRPVGDGIALFSGRSFTGQTLNKEQGVLLNILNDSLGNSTRISTLYKDSPVSIRISKSKRKINVEKDKINLSIKLDAVLTEFPQSSLHDKKVRLELQQFLEKQIEDDMNAVMQTLQGAKCDAIGIGRTVRAFHSELYDKKWNEKFSELDISIKVQVEIVKTGLLY